MFAFRVEFELEFFFRFKNLVKAWSKALIRSSRCVSFDNACEEEAIELSN